MMALQFYNIQHIYSIYNILYNVCNNCKKLIISTSWISITRFSIYKKVVYKEVLLDCSMS